MSRNDGKAVEEKCGESVSRIKLLGRYLNNSVREVIGEKVWKYPVEC